MDQFEYIVREYNLKDDRKEIPRYEQDLRAAGLDGWELVNLTPLQTSVVAHGTSTKMLATFKRKIPAQSQHAPQQQRVS